MSFKTRSYMLRYFLALSFGFSAGVQQKKLALDNQFRHTDRVLEDEAWAIAGL